ncbi:MAG: RNA polymerase subunit sigma-24 [Pseudonocardia sp. SCN 73-27]|uniref:sigma-70 family RNA polymerase sigma factor n=1 Tax=unclassified Pseudonocardia TaxID=2619320 RepID=UPI00086B2476|nr:MULTISPECIES: sigma-70 family RNA polymerase sigma factor [unclassified Pseudonocardia]ODU26749.1 MAG: RNA polymerase subunit sigma-24 [Pseudonocardia sp. SCN 72-51]ODV09179.1 MAG: RNA polymerase subunit sigma-24 [Pseudonocardia sp. SCN 73-27]
MNDPRAVAPAERVGASPPSDEVLLARIAEGRTEALAALYDRYGRRAWSLARSICRDDALAEDAVQEAFLGVWRDASRFDPDRGRVSSWLLTVVHRRAVDLVRREESRRRRTTVLDESTELPELPAAENEAIDAVVAGSVRKAMGTLPDDQRRALTLAYFGGYTQREVAALTGVPLGTVKSRTFAGLARLRTTLGDAFGSQCITDQDVR